MAGTGHLPTLKLLRGISPLLYSLNHKTPSDVTHTRILYAVSRWRPSAYLHIISRSASSHKTETHQSVTERVIKCEGRAVQTAAGANPSDGDESGRSATSGCPHEHAFGPGHFTHVKLNPHCCDLGLTDFLLQLIVIAKMTITTTTTSNMTLNKNNKKISYNSNYTNNHNYNNNNIKNKKEQKETIIIITIIVVIIVIII